MKLRIQKESDDMYFAKLVGVKGVYAQGETLQDAVKNLIEVYQMIIEYKKEKLYLSANFNEIIKNGKTLSGLNFTQLEFAL